MTSNLRPFRKATQVVGGYNRKGPCSVFYVRNNIFNEDFSTTNSTQQIQTQTQQKQNTNVFTTILFRQRVAESSQNHMKLRQQSTKLPSRDASDVQVYTGTIAHKGF